MNKTCGVGNHGKRGSRLIPNATGTAVRRPVRVPTFPLGADEDAEALFTFTFGSQDRQATTYDGTLSGTPGDEGVGGDMHYTIELRAADR
ncbi:MAG: hypothetical protein KF875_09265 [Trueperaceae bacterium]|nr:hypothetical protein [Trueperaceae bacterium]MCO5174684.1 hypothetical protein [Trueperaceae bacterium]MCW5819417.1 hypothetical protein [Trueperaceae bacterium]